MSNKNSERKGIGFVGLLQVAFIVLKLCKVIEWSWLLVLSPAWIWAILFVIAVAVVVFTK